ncbi:alpha-N-arabinofuranosidase [Pseudoduganella albidiflava]|uniref:non-reducing end alpha-L-arabinofuranosidase n=1 Tax=Pseudoduganella albidiflava TaxID=321983 RepID=A0A411WYD7_9BURK|nr:alpha-L-arabinofuranosidase C-terminal domain-containing protein [Pseudoduganella albidiflava]QBI01711.1 alpha-N-arabinofuranosidase [Pseudoduganella albidiflava]GGY40268.1 alpha-L-arabinofuranosidase [Pseudoduganella albidiflava]
MNIVKCSLVVLAMIAAPVFAARPVSISIDAGKPGPVINKNVYGQFAEHLGTGVYEGMWVGPKSTIPNTRGWRNDVVGALKALHVPLVRWPGGCFADTYHWRDGIGPQHQRPSNVHANGSVDEFNAVGTHEFFDLIEMLGAEAYVNGNVGTGSVQEMADWVEYMTADGGSPLARLRARNGREKPFKVAYFGIGNELWGCGGNMKPEYYASLYSNYEHFLRAPAQSRPKMIASGSDTAWTEVLSKELKGRTIGISVHQYTVPTGNWDVKGKDLGFKEDEWISTLANTMKMDQMIKDHVAVLDRNDPKKTIGLMIDEWGTWYDEAAGRSALFQQNSLRDALVAALNFNIFHQHAERVPMTTIAQMVNVLQAMILTDKEKMVLTPTYYAFQMYVPFQDADSLPLAIKDNTSYTLGTVTIPGVSASAARARDGKLYLALVNTDPSRAVDVAVDVAGTKLQGAAGKVLTAAAMDAHNTFQHPQAIRPAPFSTRAAGGKLSIKVPAKAVMVVALEK